MGNFPLRKLMVTSIIIFAIVNIGSVFCKEYSTVKEKFNASMTTFNPPSSVLPVSTQPSAKLLSTIESLSTTTPITKENVNATIAMVESTTTGRGTMAPAKAQTKGWVKSARKLNATSSGFSGAHSPPRFQDHLGAIDCDLPVLPRESRLWRGNETHELNLPLTVSCIACYITQSPQMT